MSPIDRKITPGPFGVINLASTARNDLSLFVEICIEGFAFAENAKKIATILGKSKEGEGDALFESKIEHAESLEEFAKVHGELEFSYLYCLVSLRLWSILETFVKDLSHEMLLGFPELQSIEALKELKGPLFTFFDVFKIGASSRNS